MPKLLPAIVAAAILSGMPAVAEDRVTLGWGRLFNNDFLGDGDDRWRTGSYTISNLRGTDWDGVLPTAPGELLEFRLRGEIIAPGNLVDPPPDDRRYVGALSVGVRTHFGMGQAEVSGGVDLVFVGPQTGLGNFQETVHDWFGFEEPSVVDNQLPNAVYPTVQGEIGQTFQVSDRVMLRPFAEAQAGVEGYVRIGGDMVLGSFGQGGLMLRDVTTGQRFAGISAIELPGTSFTLGGDFAHVFNSEYLPSDGVAVLSDSRPRLRAGMNWQGEKSSFFYGGTWLGEEFEQQPESQVIGSLRLNLQF